VEEKETGARINTKTEKRSDMKFRKYVEKLVGTVGELSADGVTYMFTVRPDEEPKTPATLIQVDEDFVIVEVKLQRMKVNRVIPFGAFSLRISEE
jgi:hypothetical protein